MRKILTLLTLVAVGSSFGCALQSDINLKQAADTAGLTNITTGDGTFENYNAVSYNKSTEIGIAVGIPFLFKIFEIYPALSNEAQLVGIAQDASDMGANAMINVEPPQETYTGFPFFIVGLYIDRTHGTGINVR